MYANLSQVGLLDNSDCPGCSVHKDLEHLLLHCQDHAADRDTLLAPFRKAGCSHLTLQDPILACTVFCYCAFYLCVCAYIYEPVLVTSSRQSFFHSTYFFTLYILHTHLTPWHNVSPHWREAPQCQWPFFVTSSSLWPTKQEERDVFALRGKKLGVWSAPSRRRPGSQRVNCSGGTEPTKLLLKAFFLLSSTPFVENQKLLFWLVLNSINNTP